MTSFVRAVETGSFSAVAREFGTSQPNVSRNVAALEDYLGKRLLHRSTRKLTLTAEGQRYYDEVKHILDALAEAEANARTEDTPSGLLRVNCPTSVGHSVVLPAAARLLARYPHLRLDLQIGDRFVNLVEEGVDLAIRIGTLKDSSLRARRIGTSERICVASRDYLAKRPAPRTPSDLAQHECVVYTLTTAPGHIWSFGGVDVTVAGRINVNTTEGIYRAVMDGLGIGYGPIWLFERDIIEGRVHLLLPEYPGVVAPVNVVYSAQRLLPRRARVFMDFMAAEFGGIPALQEGAFARLRDRLRIDTPAV